MALSRSDRARIREERPSGWVYFGAILWSVVVGVSLMLRASPIEETAASEAERFIESIRQHQRGLAERAAVQEKYGPCVSSNAGCKDREASGWTYGKCISTQYDGYMFCCTGGRRANTDWRNKRYALRCS